MSFLGPHLIVGTEPVIYEVCSVRLIGLKNLQSPPPGRGNGGDEPTVETRTGGIGGGGPHVGPPDGGKIRHLIRRDRTMDPRFVPNRPSAEAMAGEVHGEDHISGAKSQFRPFSYLYF